MDRRFLLVEGLESGRTAGRASALRWTARRLAGRVLHRAHESKPQGDLRRVEGLREACRRTGLRASEPHEPEEEVFGEPVLVPLRREMRPQEGDLTARQLLVDGDESVRRAQIAVVLRHLVFENQVVAKRVPGQLARNPVVLMVVVTGMGKDQVGRARSASGPRRRPSPLGS